VFHQGAELGRGRGKSKKEAESEAAGQALQKLRAAQSKGTEGRISPSQ
jgi:dsRNA-specific ribonuclease